MAVKEEIVPIKLSAVFGKLLKNDVTNNNTLMLTEDQNLFLVTEKIFSKAFNQVVWAYRNEYSTIYPLLKGLSNSAIESIATPVGISTVSDLVFNQLALREFIFRVQSTFKVQAALNDALENKLITQLANSIVQLPSNTEVDGKRLVPDDITDRLFSREAFKQILNENSWLVVVILIVLWGVIYTPHELLYLAREPNSD